MRIGRWGRALGYHLLAASVLVVAAIGGLIGLLVGTGVFDLRPFIGSDNYVFDPSQHPSTAGYIGEVVFAAGPVMLISLAMIPLLRRAGSPAPPAAALVISAIPTAAFALIVIDSAIKDTAGGAVAPAPASILDGGMSGVLRRSPWRRCL